MSASKKPFSTIILQFTLMALSRVLLITDYNHTTVPR